ncbi:MAG TPA: substrate-binding domain-containing protein [Xanthobacteraceae bacterium]|jgi:putative spermidine/putrescine transport system substrate-binding protein
MRVQKSKWSRRSFMKATAAGVATGMVGGFSRRASADEGLRSVGLGVSEINEIQGKATKDLGFPVAGQALGYGEMLSKILNQNDQYEIAEGYYHDLTFYQPAKVLQPLDTKKIKDWDKVTNLCKTGKLTPESSVGQGQAPYTMMWCDENGTRVQKESQYVIMVPAFHNADSMGYNPKATKRPIESWSELLNKDWKGKVGLLNVPSIGVMDCAMAVEALGLKKFANKGNMTKAEIDYMIEYLIPLKKAGHFRAFWENFGQSVNLMVNGEVVLESMWSPAVAAIQAEGVPCNYAFPKEGMRGWHGGLSVSAKVKGKQLDQAYEYINWWLAGWPAAFVARQGYYHSIPDNAKKYLEPEEWDYWYDGKAAAKDLPDPFGTITIKKGESRSGGSYWNRYSKIAVWNSNMDENDYLTKRWTEFLNS